MENCDLCKGLIGPATFFTIINGNGLNLCRGCFDNHINGKKKEQPHLKIGGLSYESLSRLFLID